MSEEKRALVIESEGEVAERLVRALGAAGVSHAAHASDGHTGLAMAEAFDYALITLELMVPKLGGPDLCRALREARPASPLLAVTARADAVALLLGTRYGIDDCVFKPVVEGDLTAKARALLARSTIITQAAAPEISDLRVGDVSFSPATRTIVVEGRTLPAFSAAEFELLYFLATHAGASFPEEEILATLWGLHPPVRLKQLSVDLRHVQQKLRGLMTGFRYVTMTERGRMRFDIPDPAPAMIKVGRAHRARAATPW
ncbi:MAG: hypothetical protein A3G81_25160 [Betaproteobacteria bacterium RIFCSPLOWO2_12_FULL_65_14]|nr:MAG: hypothetical protein A3G81_25160 [Betaproteobacteria bacterium RIFCSPLOWO2_12_FULL_65_14]